MTIYSRLAAHEGRRNALHIQRNEILGVISTIERQQRAGTGLTNAAQRIEKLRTGELAKCEEELALLGNRIESLRKELSHVETN